MGSGEALEPAYGERGGSAPMKWQETEVRMVVMAYRRWTRRWCGQDVVGGLLF
jgi:hypothetical protein